jgi:hypothetical protein
MIAELTRQFFRLLFGVSLVKGNDRCTNTFYVIDRITVKDLNNNCHKYPGAVLWAIVRITAICTEFLKCCCQDSRVLVICETEPFKSWFYHHRA